MVIIKLQTKDNYIFRTDSEVVNVSPIIKMTMEICNNTENSTKTIGFKNIDGYTMSKLLTWAENLHDGCSKEDIVERDFAYFKTDIQLLDKVSAAANFLKMDAISELCVKIVDRLELDKVLKTIKKEPTVENEFMDESS